MWLKLLQWLALLQVSQVIAAPSELLGKIFGDKTSSVADYGFMVSLRRHGMFRCGGTLISPSCVLTAAHCLDNRHGHLDDLFVHAQQQCLGDSISAAHVRQALYAWVSPQYCPQCGLDSDIAVIKLRQPFDVSSNATILSIDYNELPDWANLTVMGWGNTSTDNKPNQCLETAKVSLLPQRKCSQVMTSSSQNITPNMFCATGPIATDACQGDSGGPILYNGRTVGIVSWGFGCGNGHPGVYTRLSSASMTWFLKSVVSLYC